MRDSPMKEEEDESIEIVELQERADKLRFVGQSLLT